MRMKPTMKDVRYYTFLDLKGKSAIDLFYSYHSDNHFTFHIMRIVSAMTGKEVRMAIPNSDYKRHAEFFSSLSL